MGKLALAIAGLAAATAVFVVLWVDSRQRAKLTHCRNNLRHMGGLAVRNWSLLDPSRKGRDFWQGVREVEFRTVKGDWKRMVPDPFVCAVLGTTRSNQSDPKAIDFRGPRKISEDLRRMPSSGILGADRVGNHPSGGHVLRLDMTVQDVVPIIEAAGASDPRWTAADQALAD